MNKRGETPQKSETDLEEECTRETHPNKEKVRRERHVPDGMHVVQPQVQQREGGFHTLRTTTIQNEARCWHYEDGRHAP